MRQGIIYVIENKINGNRYVGQTVMPLNKRWLAHIQESKTFSDRPLYRAINKYGLDNFNIRILDETTEDKLNEREIYWIEYFDTYSNGYNTTTGEESNKNIKDDIRDTISQSMDNVSRSDEWANNISEGLKSKLQRGEKWGFFLSKNPGGEHCKRKVQGTNIETREVIEFDSIREASRSITGSVKYAGNISRAIKLNGSAYGYKWKRIDNKPIKRPVVGYDKKTGELVYEFESMSKASITIRGKRGTGLIKSLKNSGKYSWMGCYWFYQ